MSHHSIETVGVRYTGWAALDRDPQDDRVEFECPHCGAAGFKPARRARSEYRFIDGLLQDVSGETSVCRQCHERLRIVPVALVYNQEEKKRFDAIFSLEAAAKS